MGAALNRLDAGAAGGVRITARRGEPWITVPKLEALPEPANLRAVKDEVIRRWGALDLLDVLQDSDFLADFIGEFTSRAPPLRHPRQSAPGHRRAGQRHLRRP